MSERVLSFGRLGDQVGVLCTPSQNALADAPAIIMWNVGVNHRVGPFRVFVDASRRLSAAGFVAFRFDASGFGDSPLRREAASDAEREDRDVADAMDAVTRRTGLSRFVLVGFCSSVDAAHRVAVKDARVVGTVQIEGYAYRTPGFYKRFPLRLVSKERWARLRTGGKRSLLLRMLGRRSQVPRPETVFERSYPAWPSYARDIAALSTRGVEMLFVYVGGDTDFNHQGQFWEMFDTSDTNKDGIEVTYHAAADHTFFRVDQRQELIDRMERWLLRRMLR